MELVKSIDRILIDCIFQRVANWTMRVFGKNNFWCAQITLWVTVITVTAIVAYRFQESGTFWRLGILIVFSPFVLYYFEYLRREEQKENISLNPARETGLCLRFGSLISFVAFFPGDLIGVYFSPNSLLLYIQPVNSISLISTFYFHACNRPPPQVREVREKFVEQLP